MTLHLKANEFVSPSPSPSITTDQLSTKQFDATPTIPPPPTYQYHILLTEDDISVFRRHILQLLALCEATADRTNKTAICLSIFKEINRTMPLIMQQNAVKWNKFARAIYDKTIELTTDLVLGVLHNRSAETEHSKLLAVELTKAKELCTSYIFKQL